MRIAIIGGGHSGLVAGKNALDFGFQPTIFEKYDRIGGLWSGNGVWDTMHTNVSKYAMTFSDFDYSNECPFFPSSGNVYEYLKSYSKHFNLDEHIKLNTLVKNVKQLENKSWLLEFENLVDHQSYTEEFEFIIVACGQFGTPKIPFEISMYKDYKGILFHSFNYKSNDERLRDKVVVVVGHSFSAVEISTDLVNHASNVINIFRNPHFIVPKIIKKKANSGQDLFNCIPIDFSAYTRRSTYFIDKDCDESEKLLKVKRKFESLCPFQVNKEICPDALYINITSLSEPIKVAYSNSYIDYVKQGLINTKRANIVSFTHDGVYLDDATFLKADAIIFATGYDMKANLKFLDNSILNHLDIAGTRIKNAYKDTWIPDIDNLAFTGLYYELVTTASELQSKWIFNVLTNKLKLPSKDEMKEYIQSHIPVKDIVRLYDLFARELNLLPEDLDELKTKDKHLFNVIYDNIIRYSQFDYIKDQNNEKAIKDIENTNNVANKVYTKQQVDLIDANNFRL